MSKLEHQSDMYISTLRKFLSAMGGELRIVASFPEGEVVITQFEELRPNVTTVSRVAEEPVTYRTKRRKTV